MTTYPVPDLVPIAKGGKFVQEDFLIARQPVAFGDFCIPGSGNSSEQVMRPATWDEAIRYCNLLSKQEGLPPAHDEVTGQLIGIDGAPARNLAEVKGFRLPTGVEWDYAAQGGRPDAPYSDWGAILNLIYWDDPTSHYANPIAPKEPVTNAIGLVGMLGFIREWFSLFPVTGDCRNRICGWSHHYTNYDCFIGYHVAGEVAGEGAVHPFRIALTGSS